MMKLIKIAAIAFSILFTTSSFALGSFRCSYRVQDGTPKLFQQLDKTLCEEILNTCAVPGFKESTGNEWITVSLEIYHPQDFGEAITFNVGNYTDLSDQTKVQFDKNSLGKYSFPNNKTKFPSSFLGAMCASLKNYSTALVTSNNLANRK